MTTNLRPAAAALPAQASAAQPAASTSMRRVALASFVGTLIEYYDAGIYGFALALVFGKVFFPGLGTTIATVAAFATFGAAFLARPLGAIAFGHFGDRLGRKKTLVTTLLVMGLSTFVVGLMPTTAQIGVAAPILLVLLRVLQGLAAGGEWAGAVLFAAESSSGARRGFWAMSASLGAGVAVILAPATFLIVGSVMSEESFMAWGWRLPFLTSLLLLCVGMWIRLVMDETPVFKAEAARGGVVRFPFAEAFRNQFRVILLAGGMMVLTFCFGYLGIAYLPNYGTTVLHLTRNFVLSTTVVAGFGYTAGILLGGLMSDTLGRRAVVLIAVLLGAAWSLVIFSILSEGAGSTAYAGSVLTTLFIAGFALGPLSAYLTELFETRYRYTAVGFSYNIASVIGGAIMPIAGTSLTAAYGASAFGYLLACMALVSVTCALCLRETRGDELSSIASLQVSNVGSGG